MGCEEETSVATLVARAQAGDVQAFERLYRQHVGKVYGLCLRMVPDPVQAEILTQDVFVRAWQKLGSYQGKGVFAGWLHRLAANVVLEDRRAEARRAKWLRPLPDGDDHARHSSEAGRADSESRAVARGRSLMGSAIEKPTAAEDAIDLDRAILELPVGARLVFVLRDVMGYPYREIAEMTGVAVGTAKAQAHRARRLLRQLLGDRRDND
jgi:RNA polymerase sigma-70 factor (ECF subfamily)